MLKYIIIGFLAQLIDGTMGMAYGVSARTCLKVFAGADTVAASAVVHCAEIFTTFASGISHYKLKNYDKELLLKLLAAGVAGAVLGAWILSAFGSYLEVVIEIYLIIMGVRIIDKAIYYHTKEEKKVQALPLLGFIGGFADATGGGGWGPIVTSSLIAGGMDAKKAIGSVNIVEFFVTTAAAAAFVFSLKDFNQYNINIIGLIIGGVVAAPIAAILCKKAPVRLLLGVIGVLLIILNIYALIRIL